MRIWIMTKKHAEDVAAKLSVLNSGMSGKIYNGLIMELTKSGLNAAAYSKKI